MLCCPARYSLKSCLLGSAAVAVLAGAIGAPSYVPRPQDWRSGDIVFMSGSSWRSVFVRAWQRSARDFSHVGIVSVRNGMAYIVHASPTAGPDGTGAVVEERWDVALGPKRVVGGALYRLRRQQPIHGEIIRLTAEGFAAASVPFDHSFDLTTPDRVYCTELVWRAYREVGVDLRPRNVGTYLFPGDFLRSDALREVAVF